MNAHTLTLARRVYDFKFGTPEQRLREARRLIAWRKKKAGMAILLRRKLYGNIYKSGWRDNINGVSSSPCLKIAMDRGALQGRPWEEIELSLQDDTARFHRALIMYLESLCTYAESL